MIRSVLFEEEKGFSCAFPRAGDAGRIRPTISSVRGALETDGHRLAGVSLMALRSARERLYQTLAYEACALTIVAPLYGFLFTANAIESLGLLVMISLVCMVWAPIYNSLFDLAEFVRTGRAASDRPHGLRAAHALGLEITSCAVTVPVIMVMGGHGLWGALAIDLVLTLFYTFYAYGFHLIYDRLRPVARTSGSCPNSCR